MMLPNLLTLTTDYGLKDYYVAAFKAKISTRFPPLNILDISHSIEHFNIIEAALTLKSVWRNFPEQTIHIVDIDVAGGNAQLLYFTYQKQHFILPDNGLISLIFDDFYQYPVRKIEFEKADLMGMNIHEKFLEMVHKIVKGEDVGIETKNYIESQTFNPVMTMDTVHAKVIYIDGYRNVVLNIQKSQFDKICNGRKYEIIIKRNSIYNIVSTYSDVPENALCCLYNDAGHLEIAINKSKAAELLGLAVGNEVMIDFG